MWYKFIVTHIQNLCIFLLISFGLNAAEVKTVTWSTKHAAPPATLDEKNKNLLPLIRLGVNALPEATVMQMTFIGGTTMGIPKAKAQLLQKHVSRKYQQIIEDETFSKVPSALPYCFSGAKPKSGMASVYLPDKVNAKTQVILFLHGYGGSFTFYLKFLAEAFPDHVIICPAFGISCSYINSQYLQECVTAVSKELDIQLKKPLLIGLSAGGFGGFREYSRLPNAYSGFICMAAYPPQDVLGKTPRNGRIRLVAGAEEYFVKNRYVQRSETRIKYRTRNYASHFIPKQDHFFMLSAEDTTRKILLEWANELQAVD